MKTIYICMETGCVAKGSNKVFQALEAGIKKNRLQVEIKPTGCQGLCQEGPLLQIMPDDITYTRVKPEDVNEIITETLQNDRLIGRLLHLDKQKKEKLKNKSDWSFYQKQKGIILPLMAKLNKHSLQDYLDIGGYEALRKTLKHKPEEIVDEVLQSGLRGRGGGGFPTGKKWLSVAKQTNFPKYIICNGDEGDPGAFMDRSTMEGLPHLVLEGMIIGAYAIGAKTGYIYVRDEYPTAVENLKLAIKKAKEANFLGKNILDSGFDFDIIIKRGAGAFVCGESSALMRSIEGKIGEPTEKYVHASEKGLFGKPTVLNNVETLANIPYIITNGATKYKKLGTEKSPGTKIFSLVGKVVNTGLIEVEMGTTLKEIIYDIGGGIANNRKLKAVQTGGPSGGCIKAENIDAPIDFDSLSALGSIMGSGGMIIMDDTTCMVEIARYFINFLMEESCGKCTPCREGLLQTNKILERITQGKGKLADLETLRMLCDYIKDSALCGLGKSAVNPVLSTLNNFEDEFYEHIVNKRCPAGVCKTLTHFFINNETCIACGLCMKNCPVNAITLNNKKYLIDHEVCIKCGICRDNCPVNAITT